LVDDDVDRPAAWLRLDDRREERDELLAGVPRDRVAEHLTGLPVERPIQRRGAVPVILEPVPFCARRREWQQWIDPVERLNRRLLVDAETMACCGGSR